MRWGVEGGAGGADTPIFLPETTDTAVSLEVIKLQGQIWFGAHKTLPILLLFSALDDGGLREAIQGPQCMDSAIEVVFGSLEVNSRSLEVVWVSELLPLTERKGLSVRVQAP